MDTTVGILDSLAPLHLAEEWDNVGLLLRPIRPRRIKKILLTIDLTEAVADEAIEKKIDLIISYHPILFHPIQRLDAASAYDRTVMKLIQKNVAVYSPHTALDTVIGGVNDWLADGVGPGEISVLRPLEGSDCGQGRLVTLQRAVKLKTLAQRIKEYLGLQSLRIAQASANQPIRTVALCAGAGSDALSGVEADCYLTGEMSHHHVLSSVQRGTHVILCEHTNTERGYLPIYRNILHRALGRDVDIILSSSDADPIIIH